MRFRLCTCVCVCVRARTRAVVLLFAHVHRSCKHSGMGAVMVMGSCVEADDFNWNVCLSTHNEIIRIIIILLKLCTPLTMCFELSNRISPKDGEDNRYLYIRRHIQHVSPFAGTCLLMYPTSHIHPFLVLLRLPSLPLRLFIVV